MNPTNSCVCGQSTFVCCFNSLSFWLGRLLGLRQRRRCLAAIPESGHFIRVSISGSKSPDSSLVGDESRLLDIEEEEQGNSGDDEADRTPNGSPGLTTVFCWPFGTWCATMPVALSGNEAICCVSLFSEDWKLKLEEKGTGEAKSGKWVMAIKKGHLSISMWLFSRN